MISLYRIFQIIFGIVVSMFILYFLIQYAGNYAGFQEDVQRVTILKNLKITTESVYTYGNPVVFPDTSMYDFSSCRMIINRPNPPSIKCDFGELGSVLIPTLLSLDKDRVVVGSADLNLGWHVMHWVEVMPESKIIFTPTDTSQQTWDLMKNLTNLLPSTENLEARITFGFCDGSEVIEDICGGECEKYGFLDVLDSHRASASKCTASLSGKYRLITISSQCSMGSTTQGVCIKPPVRGVGLAYLAGSGQEFVYKDHFDIIALVIGGSRTDIFDKTMGERLYEYKNEVWRDRLSLAARIMKQRTMLVLSRYQASDEYQECIPPYSSLLNVLGTIESTIKGDYRSQAVIKNLAARLSEAKSLYQNLVNLGCEYYV